MSGNLTSYHSFEAGNALPSTHTNATTSGAVHLSMKGGKRRTYTKNLCKKKASKSLINARK